MHVGNHEKYFSRLKYKKIPVELGTAAQGHFEGVGVMVVSLPQVQDSVFLLYPAYLSTTDTCCTISNGALYKYSGFTSVMIDTHKHMSLTFRDNRQFTIPLHVQDQIDYISHITSYS